LVLVQAPVPKKKKKEKESRGPSSQSSATVKWIPRSQENSLYLVVTEGRKVVAISDSDSKLASQTRLFIDPKLKALEG
jgi:hypothetical protein